MLVYHIIQYSLLVCICTYLVNYYSAPSVSIHIKFWSVITWTLNFGLALLVPQDVYQTLTNPSFPDPQQIDSQLTPIGWQYLILYWLVYILTWTVIPVLQEWENSGDLESKDRLKRSLKTNGIFYLQMLIGAIVFLVLLIFLGVSEKMGLVTFLKCLATIWGLLLLMGLMGYALVQIPKTLWNNADPKTFLSYLHIRVVQVQDQLEQAYQQFTKITGFINYSQRHSNADKQIQKYGQVCLNMIPEDYQDKINHKNYHKFLEEIDYTKDYPVCLQSSIQHLRLLKRAIAHCRRTQRSLQYYIKMSILYEDIIESTKQIHENDVQMVRQLRHSKPKKRVEDAAEQRHFNQIQSPILDKENPFSQSNNKVLKTQLFQVKWYHSFWYLRVRKVFNRSLAILIGTCSVLILICQTQVFLTQDSSLLGWLLKIQNYETLRILIFFIIVFIMYMVNYSLFRLKLANLYGLYPKDSDGPSLMFATINFSRVGVVIVLNFFDMMKMDSEYKHVMGTVDMGILGEWVIKGLPGVLWLIALTHYFNFWGKLVDKLKLNASLSFGTHDVQDNMTKHIPYAVLKRRRIMEQQKKQ